MSDTVSVTADEPIPIEALLHELAKSEKLPRAALVACLVRIEEAGPPLRALLARAAAGEDLDEDNAALLFRGLHVLGARLDTAACAPLLALLRRSEEDLDYLLGDAKGETLPRILCGVFDGNAAAVIDLVADPELESHLRWSVMRALTFLTWSGKVPRAMMVALLERFDDQRLAPDGDAMWSAWEDAIALLGLRDLASRVAQAWADGRMDPTISGPDYFADALARAEREGDDPARFIDERVGYIEDLVEELRWTESDDSAGWEQENLRTIKDAVRAMLEKGLAVTERSSEAPLSLTRRPAHNAYRNVGRNDPCPCGSGKKYKRCCLAA